MCLRHGKGLSCSGRPASFRGPAFLNKTGDSLTSNSLCWPLISGGGGGGDIRVGTQPVGVHGGPLLSNSHFSTPKPRPLPLKNQAAF